MAEFEKLLRRMGSVDKRLVAGHLLGMLGYGIGRGGARPLGVAGTDKAASPKDQSGREPDSDGGTSAASGSELWEANIPAAMTQAGTERRGMIKTGADPDFEAPENRSYPEKSGLDERFFLPEYEPERQREKVGGAGGEAEIEVGDRLFELLNAAEKPAAEQGWAERAHGSVITDGAQTRSVIGVDGTMSPRELSDFFERDSRRYDREFLRY